MNTEVNHLATRLRWIDTHCHLDALEFNAQPDEALAIRATARQQGVQLCVIPSVDATRFNPVRLLAHTTGDAYALGIHPLYTLAAVEDDLTRLDAALTAHQSDPHLVAVGEIGLDYFVPGLDVGKQEFFYREQLKLARKHDLAVILHVRRSADKILKGLRDIGDLRSIKSPRTRDKPNFMWHGIAHAFNGSLQQAQAFIEQGLKLGFGGAMTFDSARNLRKLAVDLPLSSLVLETDAPDIPPQWLYATIAQRQAGQAQGRNSPVELPRIAQSLAELRGMALSELAQVTWNTSLLALPKLSALIKV